MRKMLKISMLLVGVALVLLIMLLSASIYTFNVLTDETLIAELRFDPNRRPRVSRASAHRRSVRRAHAAGARRPVARRRRVPEVEVLGHAGRARLPVPARPARGPLSLGDRAEQRAERRSRLGRRHRDRRGRARGRARLVEFPDRRDLRQLDVPRHRPGQRLLRVSNADGIITRFEPRPVQHQGSALDVDVNRACGADPPIWERVTAWTDDRMVGAIELARGD